MNGILVIGLTGQLGEALLPLLRQLDRPLVALSRERQPPVAGVEWLLGSLQAMPELPAGLDCILSLGPLDAFAAWFAACGLPASRVIAIGSTGRDDKLHSGDPVERDQAQRLRGAEELLFAAGSRHGAAVTVLRPTLLYGVGRDQTLSRLVKLGRRWGVVPLPSSATGLRQPVHVADVAAAMVRCLEVIGTSGHAYDLPGGETLRFDAMVRRTLARHAPACKVFSAPTILFGLALRMVALLRSTPINRALLVRLQQDQLASAAPAREAFGYQPRVFDP